MEPPETKKATPTSATSPTATESDDDTRLAVLSLLTILAQEMPQLLSEHLNSTISLLLRLSTQSAHMKVRVAALIVLWHLAHLPYPIVFPYKNQVLTALLPALDDRKRIVRQQAVKTRNEWFVLSSQTSRQTQTQTQTQTLSQKIKQ
jgi:DNA repair/transcription protein MET18/MMS19